MFKLNLRINWDNSLILTANTSTILADFTLIYIYNLTTSHYFHCCHHLHISCHHLIFYLVYSLLTLLLDSLCFYSGTHTCVFTAERPFKSNEVRLKLFNGFLSCLEWNSKFLSCPVRPYVICSLAASRKPTLLILLQTYWLLGCSFHGLRSFLHLGFVLAVSSAWNTIIWLLFVTYFITSSKVFSYHTNLIVSYSHSPNPALFVSIVLSLSDIALHIYLSFFSLEWKFYEGRDFTLITS